MALHLRSASSCTRLEHVEDVPVLQETRRHIVFVLLRFNLLLNSLALSRFDRNLRAARSPGKRGGTVGSGRELFQVGGRGALVGMMYGGHERQQGDPR